MLVDALNEIGCSAGVESAVVSDRHRPFVFARFDFPTGPRLWQPDLMLPLVQIRSRRPGWGYIRRQAATAECKMRVGEGDKERRWNSGHAPDFKVECRLQKNPEKPRSVCRQGLHVAVRPVAP